MQIDQLWEYMQVDMAADRFEAEMRAAPNRAKLIQERDFLLAQQESMKRLEAGIEAMENRIEALTKELEKAVADISDFQTEAQATEPATLEEAAARVRRARSLADALQKLENELSKIQREASASDSEQKKIRVNSARMKQEYDKLKLVYDAEFKRDSAILADKRKAVEAASKKLPPDLLTRYNAVKQHVTPPIAKLVGGQCGGCFMNPPSATLKRVAAGEEIVECDNCGRMLMPSD